MYCRFSKFWLLGDMNKLSDTNKNVAIGKFPDIKPNTVLTKIIQSIYDSYAPFFSAIKNHFSQDLHTEKSLVQEFVIQNDCQLRNILPSIRIEKEYTDNFYKTKGIPDFAFIPLEEGVSHTPLFIVEAKLLPAPEKSREKEYVIGHNENGGIERFKLGKHGTGLFKCGLLGFMTMQSESFWINNINSWILQLSKENSGHWCANEILRNDIEDFPIYSYVYRKDSDMVLYHFLVSVQLLPYYESLYNK